MKVLFLAPGFPDEMTLFCEGLAELGVSVFGIGEQPLHSLPKRCQRSLTAYFQVRSLFDEETVVADIAAECAKHHLSFDRVESLWEPLVVLAAKLREQLGVPGMSVEVVRAFRDKELMKQRLEEAGIRVPRHQRARNGGEIRDAVAVVGYPVIVKPVAGAGSADTYRANDEAELEIAIERTRHVAEFSIEEFIEGEEYTFDTICSNGVPLYFNHSWYRPRPLIQRTVEWISPQTVALRDVDAPHLRKGREMGLAVLEALGFESGFTHMEWYLTDKGEAVFGEIGARAPGARSVDIMNFACDADFFRGWGEAVCFGRLQQPWQRRYNAAIVFKRAFGEGSIRRIEGLEAFMARHGAHVPVVDLLPIGARRRNWKHTLLSDGHLVVRHPDLATCIELADAIGSEIRLFAE
jgi:ATP-grasp domain